MIQLRTGNVLPDAIAERVVRALGELDRELEAGAIVSLDLDRARARILPLSSSGSEP